MSEELEQLHFISFKLLDKTIKIEPISSCEYIWPSQSTMMCKTSIVQVEMSKNNMKWRGFLPTFDDKKDHYVVDVVDQEIIVVYENDDRAQKFVNVWKKGDVLKEKYEINEVLNMKKKKCETKKFFFFIIFLVCLIIVLLIAYFRAKSQSTATPLRQN